MARPCVSACEVWTEALNRQDSLVCTNYIALEMAALVQRRLGLEASRVLLNDILPVLLVHWVDENLHSAAAAAYLTAGNRRLSLVDCVSFEAMRRLGLGTAFAFDEHFREQGFHCLPQ